LRRKKYLNGELDKIDLAILEVLAADARTPMRELAERVGLSAPSVTERVRRLEEVGVINGYRVDVNPAALGKPIGAYLRVRPMPGELDRVAKMLGALAEVTACDRVTGDDCFVAKVHVANMESLERLIDRLLPYAATNTSIIVSTPVEARLPGIPAR
jgi:Lrp/AsnC family transcriptional regulator, leucine-responsive regulatory protein